MLHLSNVSYIFSGNQVRALDGVSLELPEGKIYAIIGENGAGKSTLARICTGHLQNHQGHLRLDDANLILKDPVAGIEQGLALVPQHPRLAGELPVWQNLLLGTPCGSTKNRFIQKRRNIAVLQEQLNIWQIQLPLEIKAQDLDASHIHWTVIAEALLANPRYIFLDEPSAPYGPEEVAELYALLRRCANKGMGIVVITHRLQEVIDYADNVHILRHGKLIESLTKPANITKSQLLLPMFGENQRDLQSASSQIKTTVKSINSKPGLILQKISVKQGPGRILHSINLQAPTGYITGVIGMKDQGLEILEDILAGITKPTLGRMEFEGKDLRKLSPLDRGYIPGRRFQRGIATGLDIRDNIISRARAALFPSGWLAFGKLQEWLSQGDQELLQKPDAPIISLSGGMIQRLIFQRELNNPIPRLVIAAEPFWGLDRHFQTVLRDRLVELSEQGITVLLISSDLDEAIECCDSINILHGGRIVHSVQGPNYDRSDLALKLVHPESMQVIN